MNDIERQRWNNLVKYLDERERRMTPEEREEQMRRIWEKFNPSIPRTFLVRVEE